MAGIVKVNGTSYTFGGGRTKVNGTAYSIKQGKTKIGGMVKTISFKFLVTESFLNNAEFYGQTKTISTDTSTNSGMFTIGYRGSVRSWDWTTGKLSQIISLSFPIDVTLFKKLTFDYRKPASGGISYCNIYYGSPSNWKDLAYKGSNMIFNTKSDISTSWTSANIDISNLTGTVQIIFEGGYPDSTGLISSLTNVRNIVFS